MAFTAKAKAQQSANRRKKGFRQLIKQTDDPKRKKFLRQSIKTVKVRRLAGEGKKIFVVEGR